MGRSVIGKGELQHSGNVSLSDVVHNGRSSGRLVIDLYQPPHEIVPYSYDPNGFGKRNHCTNSNKGIGYDYEKKY